MTERPTPQGDALLEVRDLRTRIAVGRERSIDVVDGISFGLARGRTLAIVGESGSGKSLTALSIVRLLPTRARIAGGSVLFDGRDLTTISEAEMRGLRGDRIGIMFQDPMTALNPSLRVGFQIAEALVEHRRVDSSSGRARAAELIERMGLPHPDRVLDSYPHELSGGMRQRAILAMTLACHPDVVIADEPTTALDATTQDQILDLLVDIQRAEHIALLIITHDLGVVARVADDVLVMYAGRALEYGDTRSVFARPAHPYTQGLLASVELERHAPGEPLPSIGGSPPRFDALPPGCPFEPRCSFAQPRCGEVRADLGAAPGYATLTACVVAQEGRLPVAGAAGEVGS